MSRQPPERRPSPNLALDSLAATLGGSVIATVITAVAAAIALVSAALALYDLLASLTSPAGAAAITAIALTVVAIVSASLGQRIVRARAIALDARLAASKPFMRPEIYRAVGEVGLVVLGFAAERALRRRAQPRKRH
jgi:hypothetical protein